MTHRRYRRKTETVYRRYARKVISVFHTVFTRAVLVISGTMAVQITVTDDRREHFARRGKESSQLHDCVVNNWQHA